MRTYVLIATLALMTLCSTVTMAEKKKGGGASLSGTIMSLPDKTVVFDVPQQDKPGKRYIVYVGDHTTITIDGKPATHRDLAVGMEVSVKGTKIAKSVDATTPQRKGW